MFALRFCHGSVVHTTQISRLHAKLGRGGGGGFGYTIDSLLRLKANPSKKTPHNLKVWDFLELSVIVGSVSK